MNLVSPVHEAYVSSTSKTLSQESPTNGAVIILIIGPGRKASARERAAPRLSFKSLFDNTTLRRLDEAYQFINFFGVFDVFADAINRLHGI